MINTIITKLKEKCDLVTEIVHTFTYVPQSIDKYPCVIIEFLSNESQRQDTIHVQREWRFSLKILANLEDTHEASQAVVRDIAYKLVNQLEADPKLDDSIDWSELTLATRDSYNDSSPQYVIEIEYIAKEIFNMETV